MKIFAASKQMSYEGLRGNDDLNIHISLGKPAKAPPRNFAYQSTYRRAYPKIHQLDS